MANDDGVNENEISLCCALLCINCGLYQAPDCIGCSGKMGFCCFQAEVCCKPNAPMLYCGCCGPKLECDGLSVINVQCQICNVVISGALPCNAEVPVAVSILGLTLFPKIGCCITIGELKPQRREGYVNEGTEPSEGYGSIQNE